MLPSTPCVQRNHFRTVHKDLDGSSFLNTAITITIGCENYLGFVSALIIAPCLLKDGCTWPVDLLLQVIELVSQLLSYYFFLQHWLLLSSQTPRIKREATDIEPTLSFSCFCQLALLQQHLLGTKFSVLLVHINCKSRKINRFAIVANQQ